MAVERIETKYGKIEEISRVTIIINGLRDLLDKKGGISHSEIYTALREDVLSSGLFNQEYKKIKRENGLK